MTRIKKTTNRKKDHKRTVYLSPAIIAEAEAEAQLSGETFSEFNRLALQERIDRKRQARCGD